MRHLKLKATLLFIGCFFATNLLISLPLQLVEKAEAAQRDDNALLLKTAEINGKKELQISFSGQEPVMIGNLEIMNSSNDKIDVINEIDVKSSPEYYAVDISKYQPGTYTIALNIEGKIFTASFIVK